MKTAVITYHSKTGTTRRYAQEIGKYLSEKGIETHVMSIKDYCEELFDGVNYIFFGCWTSGLMVILQKPEQEWIDFTQLS